jgi:hypothetical protein
MNAMLTLPRSEILAIITRHLNEVALKEPVEVLEVGTEGYGETLSLVVKIAHVKPLELTAPSPESCPY